MNSRKKRFWKLWQKRNEDIAMTNVEEANKIRYIKFLGPEKIYVDSKAIGNDISTTVHTKRQDYPTCTEYTRTDAFIEKARKWFEKQSEWHDLYGNRHCDMSDFEEFKNYIKGE